MIIAQEQRMPTEEKFWPRSYRDIVTAIVATGTIAAAVWKFWREVPIWVFPVAGGLVYLVHVFVLSRRLGRAEARLREIDVGGTAVTQLASEREWEPADALLVELMSGDAHFVRVYDDHVDVLCIVRFLNVASDVVVVDHAKLSWKVEQAAGKLIAEGTYNEPVTIRPLAQGEHETVPVHQGRTERKGEFPSCAGLMTLSGYVTVKSRAWSGNRQRAVSHWIWVSVLNQQAEPPKIHAQVPSTQATPVVRDGAIVMAPPNESPATVSGPVKR